MQRVPELKGNVSSSLHSAPPKGLLVGAGAGPGALGGQAGHCRKAGVLLSPPAKSHFGHNGCAGRVCSECRGGVGQQVLSRMLLSTASSASVGPPAPGPAPSRCCLGYGDTSSRSPVNLTLCCGQVPPSRRILCISWKRYEDCVGEKMLQAGPDPLNDTPRCL